MRFPRVSNSKLKSFSDGLSVVHLIPFLGSFWEQGTVTKHCVVVLQWGPKQGAVLSLPILTKTTLSWLAVHLATNGFRGNDFKQTAIADQCTWDILQVQIQAAMGYCVQNIMKTKMFRVVSTRFSWREPEKSSKERLLGWNLTSFQCKSPLHTLHIVIFIKNPLLYMLGHQSSVLFAQWYSHQRSIASEGSNNNSPFHNALNHENIYLFIASSIYLFVLANSHGRGSCCMHRPEPGDIFCCSKRKISCCTFFMSSEFVVICSDSHVWYVLKRILKKHVYLKTLPKAQQYRGSSSYHKFLHKPWSNFNFRISIKY